MLFPQSGPSSNSPQNLFDCEIALPAVVRSPLSALRSAVADKETLASLSEDPFIYFIGTGEGAQAVHEEKIGISSYLGEISRQQLLQRSNLPSLFFVRGIALIDHLRECQESGVAKDWCRSLIETLDGISNLLADRFRTLLGFRLAYMHGVNPAEDGDGMALLRHVVVLATRNRILLRDHALTVPLTDIATGALYSLDNLVSSEDSEMIDSVCAWRDLLREHQGLMLRDNRPSRAPFALSEAGCRAEGVLISLDFALALAKNQEPDIASIKSRLAGISQNIENSGELISDVSRSKLFMTCIFAAIRVAQYLQSEGRDRPSYIWCREFAGSRLKWVSEILSSQSNSAEMADQVVEREAALRDVNYLSGMINAMPVST